MDTNKKAVPEGTAKEIAHPNDTASANGAANRKRLNPNTKRARIIAEFVRLGEIGMNCFEAANRHHDYVLRSTVSDIQRDYGIKFLRKPEKVPNAFGTLTDCSRYWLAGSDAERARGLVGEVPA